MQKKPQLPRLGCYTSPVNRASTSESILKENVKRNVVYQKRWPKWRSTGVAENLELIKLDDLEPEVSLQKKAVNIDENSIPSQRTEAKNVFTGVEPYEKTSM